MVRWQSLLSRSHHAELKHQLSLCQLQSRVVRTGVLCAFVDHAMDNFKGQAEKFHLTFASDSGSSERVLCEIGLEGVILKTTDGQRTLKKYPLNHISRWALRGTSLVLYTKTPVDVEERTVTLQAGDSVIRSVLDTLTCCCMQ